MTRATFPRTQNGGTREDYHVWKWQRPVQDMLINDTRRPCDVLQTSKKLQKASRTADINDSQLSENPVDRWINQHVSMETTASAANSSFHTRKRPEERRQRRQNVIWCEWQLGLELGQSGWEKVMTATNKFEMLSGIFRNKGRIVKWPKVIESLRLVQLRREISLNLKID